MEIPDTFKDVIITFINDLNITFPEYFIFWNKWMNPTEDEIKILFKFMLNVFPERMFDILTQNENIFDINSSINTVFLPNIEFKLLFNTKGITENTKQTIWKYLQLIMMSLMPSIKNKSQFGETVDLFETMDETFIQEKLNESILKMTEFFDNVKFKSSVDSNNDDNNNTCGDSGGSGNGDGNGDGNGGGNGGGNGDGNNTSKNESASFDNKELPDTEKLFKHLQSLFDGKIGSLAKEFAEEFSNDMSDILNEEELKNATSIKDILPKLLKNPKKILSLVKSIHDKVNKKMDSGEISRDELINETQEMMKKMKEMGGVDNFADMLKGMANKMGMGGKGVRIDKNALKKMESEMKFKEQIRKKLELRKSNNIVKNEKTGELDFVCGEDKQEKSYLEQNEEINKIMDELKFSTINTSVSNKNNNNASNKKKQKNKKNKK